MFRFVLLVSLATLLCACQPQQADPQTTEPAANDNLLSTQIDALQKARDVEQDLLEAAQKQREQIEAESSN